MRDLAVVLLLPSPLLLVNIDVLDNYRSQIVLGVLHKQMRQHLQAVPLLFLLLSNRSIGNIPCFGGIAKCNQSLIRD